MPKTASQWIVLIGTVLSGAISAWVHAGGPNPIVSGVPVLGAILGVIALYQQPPKGESS